MRTPVRSNLTLSAAGREFWRHPSPWGLALTFAGALTARIVVGDWRLTDVVLPALMIAAFPVFEWIIHVAILHWRPRSVGRFVVDPLLARKHREHHCEPRKVELIFIPWQTLPWVIPTAVAVAFVAFPRLGLGLTYLVVLTALGWPTSGRITLSTPTTSLKAVCIGRFGVTIDGITSKTNTTGSPSPPPEPPTGCSARTRTSRRYRPPRQPRICTV